MSEQLFNTMLECDREAHQLDRELDDALKKIEVLQDNLKAMSKAYDHVVYLLELHGIDYETGEKK